MKRLLLLLVIASGIELVRGQACEFTDTATCDGQKVRQRLQSVTMSIAWTACDASQDSYKAVWGKPFWEGYPSLVNCNADDANCTWDDYGDSGTVASAATSQAMGSSPTPEQQIEFSAQGTVGCVQTKNSGNGTFNARACCTVFMDTLPLPPEDVTVKASVYADPDPNKGTFITWPSVGAAETFYASTTGDATVDCNAAQNPVTPRTLQVALNCVNSKNDTVVLANGTYLGNFTLPAQDGDASNPITIQGTGCNAVLTSSSATAALVLSRNYWKVTGINFANSSGASTSYALRIFGSGSTTGNNNTIDSSCFTTHSGGSASAYIEVQANGGIGSGNDNRIINSTFSSSGTPSGPFDFIELQDQRNTEVYNCIFDPQGGTIHTAVEIHGSPVRTGSAWVHGCSFKAGTYTSSANAWYIGAYGSIFEDNLCDGTVSNSASVGSCINIIRSGNVDVINNTMYSTSTTVPAIGVDERSRNVLLSGNIIQGYKYAVTFAAAKAALDNTLGFRWEYNLFCGYATAATLTNTAADANQLSLRNYHNCTASSCTVGSCQPKFTDATNHDFSLQGTSNAVDMGDPLARVPTGGGRKRDIGAMEFGGTWPFTSYQARFTTSDTTPKIGARYADIENEKHSFYPGIATNTRIFTQKQIQIDTSPTFDSQTGGHPLYDTNSYVPDVISQDFIPKTALSSGTYYVRARYRHAQLAFSGGWSQPVVFTIQ